MTATNITDIKAAMSRRGLRPRKRLGQNFLKERGLLDLMVCEGEVSSLDVILEIGSGPGCLTESLSLTGARILAVEKDAKMLEVARELLGVPSNVRWVQMDVLESKNRINPDVARLLSQELQQREISVYKLIANLPYNIAVPVIINMLEGTHYSHTEPDCRLFVVTVQKEVAHRLLARQGDSDYGITSVLVSQLAEIRRVRKISPSAFWPEPSVDSSVIKIKPRHSSCPGELDYINFKKVTQGIFSHRRKSWYKSLVLFLGLKGEKQITKKLFNLGFNTELRAESLTSDEILKLTRRICEIKFKGF